MDDSILLINDFDIIIRKMPKNPIKEYILTQFYESFVIFSAQLQKIINPTQIVGSVVLTIKHFFFLFQAHFCKRMEESLNND